MLIKILIISIFPAPYRVAVFNELGKNVELDVIFERTNDYNRLSDWFSKEFKNFTGYILSDSSETVKKDIQNIKKDLWNGKYDAVILYDYSTVISLYFASICRMKKIPYFLNCDGAFINKSALKKIVKEFVIKNATACFASGNMAARYFEYFKAKKEVIYYHPFTSLYEYEINKRLCSDQEKNETRKKLNINGKKIAITASRFISSKRIDVLIEAWASMPSDYHLIIAGAGELEETYKQQINKLNLKNIILSGFLKKDTLFEYMKASDVFVLPTESDTWGLVINEAMACGLPVITTNMCIAGIELVENGQNGYIVPVGDVDALKRAIRQVLVNEDLHQRMANNALKAIKKYTYENIGISHFNALKNTLDANKRNNNEGR
ncbi:glycosyl transferase GT4 family [Peptoclostridium acidaminophilum DSM 3953]|uniref:Glycosyl transferase GT4 family n=1 Tax=Peptoclostridium acidaminophilum DSM 3953 TaxID=1286171 RepID=W8TM59_PEPAC|nr:glycosyltransferase family 4 protein [Peptoclostridium acidaminophilum]AHM57292.1 glycosyl transferase GT4 family [Peptoclostridium acidaminophilum DSM 3953]